MADARAEMLAVPADTPTLDESGQGELRVAGEMRTFENLVAANQERVTRLCYRLLGWREDVEDVVQDVFVTTLRALPDFRGDSSFSTWLTRIVVNTCRSAGRRRSAWLRWVKRSASEGPAEPGSVADDALVAAERHGQVRRAVAALPAKYREVVVLRYLEEIETAEIGEILGIKRNAVEVRLNRARARLRASLAGIVEV